MKKGTTRCARLAILIPAAAMLTTTGCTSYRGVKPITPKQGATVDSLQPTFKWEAESDDQVTYDLVIYEPTKGFSSGESAIDREKKRVYYRQRLKGDNHQIEKPLAPKQTYTWSLRARKGEEVSRWTAHETTVFLIISRHRRLRLPEFSTPAE